MTEYVVTEKNNTVVVQKVIANTVTTEPAGRVVVTGIMGPPGASTINALGDIDITSLTTGSILVYSTNTQKWTSTTTLEDQYMNGGAF